MGASSEILTGERSANGNVGTAIGSDARPESRTTSTYQRLADDRRGTGGESLADFLGYFSVGLGLAQVTMPGMISRVVGIDPHDDRNRTIMRLMGLREISHGVALLSNQQPAKSAWARVAGDALDLALLGKALTNPDNGRGRTMFAVGNVLVVAALDVIAARLLSQQPETPANAGAEEGIIRTTRSVTVRKPIAEVYAFWRDFENFPRFMRHVESVNKIDERRSQWTAKGPAGTSVEWEAEITEERENELIAWRSVEGSDVHNAGRVTFRKAAGNRGTELHLVLEYDPPFGKLGSKIAMLFREEPGQQAQDDLRHFKQVMEIGEIVLSDATKQRGPHPAVPNEKPVQL